MSQESNFAYWRQRIEETPDHDELNGTVLEAVEALMQCSKADQQDCLRLSDEVLAYISKKQDLGEKKQRAMKALEPLSRISQAAAKSRLVETEAAPDKNFEHVFTDHLCTFLQSRLEPWRITTKKTTSLPFLFAPGFADVFEKVVREHVISVMLENRRLKLMVQDLNLQGRAEDVFFAEFDKPTKENVVRYAWDSYWDNIRNALFAKQKAEEEEKKRKKEKKSLFSKFKRKKEPAYIAAAVKISESQEEKARQLFADIKEGAAENNFITPELKDINVYQALFEYDPETTRDSMKGIQQILHQETSEGHGREGSTRQHLCGLINKLPSHCGEFLVLWAYFICAQDFSPDIMNSFIASQGTSIRERKRHLPFFFRWVSPEIQVLE